MTRGVILELIDREGEPVRLLLMMEDGRKLDMAPTGEVSRSEARVICGGMLNAMRAGIRADQFRHGQVLREGPPSDLRGYSAPTQITCGPAADAEPCAHDFQGWRAFEDGNGGEAVCTRCGLGAMAHTLRTGP